jgi:hypothetical protein
VKRNESLYDVLNEYLDLSEDSINLLDETIDNEIQLEFFECSKANGENLSADEIIERKELIFDEGVTTDQKKILLVQLASIGNIEAYRTIERYLRESDTKLYKWTYLALMANRSLIESMLLEENKVLITTGLGAKGHKLRYFIVFFTEDGSAITRLQQKIIRNELNFAFRKFGAEIEDIFFEDGFATFLTIVPMKVPVQVLFDSIIKECNEFGGFLFDDYIITNSKIMSIEEIREFLTIKNIL